MQKWKWLFVCLGIIAIIRLIGCCIECDDTEDNYDYSSKSYTDTEITDQDRENLEFYYEMEDAWNEEFGLD